MDEVWIGHGPRRTPAVGTYELSADTNSVPAILKPESPDGTWVAVGPSEVEVGMVDPFDSTRTARAEIWMNVARPRTPS